MSNLDGVVDYPVFKTVIRTNPDDFDKTMTEMLQDGWEIDSTFHHVLSGGDQMFVAYMVKEIDDVIEGLDIIDEDEETD